MNGLSRLAPPAPAGRPESGFGALPPGAKVFICATVALGGGAIAYSLPQLTLDRPLSFVGLLTLALLTSTAKLDLPLSRSGSTLSLSFAMNLATLAVLGSNEAVIIGMLSAWSQCTLRMKQRNALYRTLFSIATVGISVEAAGMVFDLLKGDPSRFLVAVVRPLVPATLVYFFLNTALVAAAIALSTRQSLPKVWMGSFLWSAPSYFVAAGAAALAAAIWERGSLWWGVLVVVPLYLTYRSYRSFIARLDEERAQVRRLSDVQLATIEALALAIEIKDRTTQAQVRRMQIYAEGLALALEMPDEEIPGVKTAALLHDIGHLAVPEHILSKPGPLSYEEFERVKIHPGVGADILAMVPFPYPVAPLILAHHEHWNGGGYPKGLRGGEIPLGARVLAVADTFTSLLFDRPYRKARSYSEAVATLRACAGTSLDPAAVYKFLEVLPALEVQCQNLEEAAWSHDAEEETLRSLSPSALANIAGAHNEAKVLYEIAQALGTSLGVEETLNLVSTKLQGLLPFSCCALFLGNGDGVPLSCRIALGTASQDVETIEAVTFEVLMGRLPGRTGEPASPLRSVLVSPLVVSTHTVGALALYHVAAEFYQHEHRRVLDLVSRHAAPVIQNALVFEQAQEASLTDPLTELANRRALEQHLLKELARAERQQSKVTLLVLDMDGLKYFNDQYGHHTGDRAIREVAGILRSHLRPYDLCARTGGDEFVVALWECDAAQAIVRLRELQEAVGGTTLDAGETRIRLGISVGAATFPDDGATADQLLGVADQRMYGDKQARRQNQRIAVPMREYHAGGMRATG
jgi:diguanylate cyclase (GGDEF)-like protein